MPIWKSDLAMPSLRSIQRPVLWSISPPRTAPASTIHSYWTRGAAPPSWRWGELQVRYLNDVLSISRSLNGLSRDIVTQPPTLPTEHVSPKKGLFATLSALAVGFALLLWVFMRQAWRNAVLDPQAAPKLARLRAALGWHN